MSDPEQILLRFDNIVGTRTNQVPPGSRVEAAVLDMASVVASAPADGRFPVLDKTRPEGYEE